MDGRLHRSWFVPDLNRANLRCTHEHRDGRCQLAVPVHGANGVYVHDPLRRILLDCTWPVQVLEVAGKNWLGRRCLRSRFHLLSFGVATSSWSPDV